MADCSIAGTLEIIGDRWTILILRDAFRGVRRFDEIQQDLGIARNILTERLTKLVDHGVLEKRQYQDRPARYEYRLTPKGVDLSPALVALMRWGDKHLAGDDVPTSAGADNNSVIVAGWTNSSDWTLIDQSSVSALLSSAWLVL